MFLVLFVLILYVCFDSVIWGRNQYLVEDKVSCSRTHTVVAVPLVRLDPAIPISQVKHSTTDQPRSLLNIDWCFTGLLSDLEQHMPFF